MTHEPKASSFSQLRKNLATILIKEVTAVFVNYIKEHPEILKEKDSDKMKEILCREVLDRDYEDMPSISLPLNTTTPASGKRTIGDMRIFEVKATEQMWEDMYQKIMNPKYKKNTKNFSRNITGNPVPKGEEPPIFLIPRERGGPSYLKTPLEGVNNEDVQFAPISKGYPMQDVSSFTLGPVEGEGLCLVNAAFSKSITVAHIEGGGHVELSRKNYWKRPKTPSREIVMVSAVSMRVNDKKVNIQEWLAKNEKLWLPEWQVWRKAIALSSEGGFHWTDGLGETVMYRYGERYLNFVQWKLECYIRPAYDLMSETDVYRFLEKVYKKRVPCGLVHFMATKNESEKPITREFILELMTSPNEMICLPYVVAGRLLHIAVPHIK